MKPTWQYAEDQEDERDQEELVKAEATKLSIDQQAATKGRSFIIRDLNSPGRIFGIDLVFDEGENFRAYIEEYLHISGPLHKRRGRQRMYNHEEVVFTQSIGFDLTKREDPEYLNALALDVVNTYVMDSGSWIPGPVEEKTT